MSTSSADCSHVDSGWRKNDSVDDGVAVVVVVVVEAAGENDDEDDDDDDDVFEGVAE